jgi:uncharacterized protein YodC (DUF2158 family)
MSALVAIMVVSAAGGPNVPVSQHGVYEIRWYAAYDKGLYRKLSCAMGAFKSLE